MSIINMKNKMIDANVLLKKLKYIKKQDDFCKFSVDYFQLTSFIKFLMEQKRARKPRRKKNEKAMLYL